MQQDNKPNNTTMNSMGRDPRSRKKGQGNEAQEFINETENPKGAPSTAQGGQQPTKKVPHS